MKKSLGSAGVNVYRQGPLGFLELSNPDTLNALSLATIDALHQGLTTHESDSDIHAIVIISNNDRAFCAGGQMKHLRELAINKRFDDIDAFFKREYELNLAIAACSKPFIALIDGIAMGGGLGISVHGHFRVVTERSVMAMPETRIGFFPDVGASYFLQRLDYRAGYWLGLTATSLKAHESYLVGLATHFVSSTKLTDIKTRLGILLTQFDRDDTRTAFSQVSATLDRFNEPPNDEEFVKKLKDRAGWFADSDLQQIRQRLHHAIVSNHGGQNNTDSSDAQQLLSLLDSGSPHSVDLTLQLLDQTLGKTLRECLDIERKLSSEAYRHPDFIEGIRAVLVDKDRNPTWLGIYN